MKKQLLIAALMLFCSFANAQEPSRGHEPPSIEERLKRTKEVMQKDLQLSAAQLKTMESAFKTFFLAADKIRKDNPSPQPPPMDTKVKEQMDKLAKQRDESVKKILTAEQFKKYKEVELKMRPPRPGEKGAGGPPPPRN